MQKEYEKLTFPLATCIVMSGIYEDDLDKADEIIYTGQGGNDLLGNHRQIGSQQLKRGNLALKVGFNGSYLLLSYIQCFLIGLSFLIGLVPIRTIRTISRPLIGLIVHITVQHITGLYKYISYMYGIYIIYHILYIYIVDIEHISS